MSTITEVWDRLASTVQLALLTLEDAIATGDTKLLPAAQQAVMDGWHIFEEAFAADLAQELAAERPSHNVA